MKKTFFTLLTAGSILFTASTAYAFEENNYTYVPMADSHTAVAEYSAVQNGLVLPQDVQQVSSAQAAAMAGSFRLNHNSNIRLDAGTNHRVVTVASKGSIASATHHKTVGSQVWYKVNVNGTSGWILSTLMTPVASNLGTFSLKYNTNVRADAGTHNRVLTVGTAGSVSKVTEQKTYGGQTWSKVTFNGKTGWVLSSLLNAATTAVSSNQGTFSLKYNTNVRADAGTHNRVLTVGTAGAVTKVTEQKSYGGQTWSKVSINGTTGWVLDSLLAPTTSSSSEIISIALSLQGIPYVFGGTTTRGFDCSGFTQYVFNKAGQSLSRTTLTQFAETKAVSNPKPGDLVFFANTYRAGISHVGIYIGNNEFVHAGGAKSEVKSLNDPYWKTKFHSFRTK